MPVDASRQRGKLPGKRPDKRHRNNVRKAPRSGAIEERRVGWSYPRTARLLRPEEFAAALKKPAKVRNTRFALHASRRPSDTWRLGLAIPKKQEPKAVRRNVVKRVWREAFRLRAELFDGSIPGHDLVVRLQARLPAFPPAQLRSMCRADAEALLNQLLARLSDAAVAAAPK